MPDVSVHLKWAAGVIGSLIILIKPVDWYIDYRIAEYQKNRKGGFRYELSKEIGVDEENIPHAFGEMYMNLQGAVADINAFRTDYLPMLEKEAVTIDVGIKKEGDRLYYLHTDGNEYPPIYWEAKRAYYFRDQDDEWEMCH